MRPCVLVLRVALYPRCSCSWGLSPWVTFSRKEESLLVNASCRSGGVIYPWVNVVVIS